MPRNPELNAPLSNEEFTRLRERFHDDEENYQILRGERQGVRGKIAWDTDHTLEQYTKETDRMIGILDGTISERRVTDPTNPERSEEKPDTVIWLDKSARPVSWFVDAFWEQFAEPDAKKPDYEFLNIDRVNWFVRQGHLKEESARRLGPNDFDIKKVPAEDIARIRAYFVRGNLTEDNWQDQVWNMSTRLDGKNVLIIDEVMNQGGTLAIATQLLKAAVPEATISGDYFWNPPRYSIDMGINNKSGMNNLQMESAPVWYDNNSGLGRGIGEISSQYWEHLYEKHPTQANLKRKIASHVLSAPHYNADFKIVEDKPAKQLEQDIAFLTYGVGAGKVRRIPARGRGADDFVKILDRQGLSVRDNLQYSNRRSEEVDRRLGIKR